MKHVHAFTIWWTRVIVVVIIMGWIFSGWFSAFNLNLLLKPRAAHAAVAAGVIVAWPSTIVTIPTGWSRVTALDDYFLEGTTSDPSAVAGGSDTHSHASPTHTHDTAHTHSGSSSVSTGSSADKAGTGTAAQDGHTHTVSLASSSGSNNPQSANFGTASNDPPYTDVIWIQSDGTTDIPNGAWAIFNSDTLPSSWARANSGSFLHGALASGNGGGTGGSSNSHTHTDSGHTHTEGSHTHAESTTGVSAKYTGGAGSTLASSSHTHTLTESGSPTATETSGTAALANGDGQPPFYTLNIIQNNTGSGNAPTNIIAMWAGTIASIPTGWVVCNGSSGTPNLNDYFIKGASGDGQLGTTGGALTHTHGAGTAHTHPIASHTHTYSVTQTGSTAVGPGGSGKSSATQAHAHANFNISSTGTTGSQAVTADANSENRPPYKEIVFIQYQPPTGSLSLTASSSQSFNTSLTLLFTAQTSTASNVGALQVADTRGGSPGWTLSGAANDWRRGNEVSELDYDGGGSDDGRGKLCLFPSNSTLYAESGSLTGVSKGGNSCFSATLTSITILSATGGNGTGTYWLTDMPAEQYFPGSPTVGTYTTTIVYTLSMNNYGHGT